MEGRKISRWLLLGAALVCAGVLIGLPWFRGNGGPAGPLMSSVEARVIGKISPEDAKSPGKRMAALAGNVTQGALRVVTEEGEIVECPLKHTDVKADVSGFIARVKVTQTFYNPMKEKIEAVYVFPLPHSSAVDDMTLVLDARRIVGIIKRRAEARSIYEQALAQGATAALLEQERPNIFTQSVGNIPPGQEVNVEISYVDVLAYDMGVYEFHFPMVVGPRYIPGSPTSKIPPVPDELKGKVGELDKRKVPEGPDKPTGTGWAPDTDRVGDASRITPPVLKPGFRNGHDISLSLTLDAGVPVHELKVTNHKAEVNKTGEATAAVRLAEGDTIPNKDFVLRYKVVGEKPAMALLTHTDAKDVGYFLLMIQPKEDEKLKQSPPREIVFLVDVSGSMSGNPTAKVRETMAKLLKLCKKDDTVQVITFASRSQRLFPNAVPVTRENMETALGFTRGLRGSGGTEMLKGIKMAINDPIDPKRLRVVMLLTDGFIGNESEIIGEVGRRCGDQIRFWCLGIGNSVNRHLIDGVARQGGGMGKVMGLNEDPTELVQEVMLRIHRAQLAKIKLDWGGMQVFETYPTKIPELWAERPVILFGLYKGGGRTTVTVSGSVEGEPASWPLEVDFPARAPGHDVLEKVWARNKIEDLMQQTFYEGSPEIAEAVTSIALEYRLMSQYTSFVAVDESQLGKLTEPARPPRRMLVPVPIPEGTRYEGFFGRKDEMGGFDDFTGGDALIPLGITRAGDMRKKSLATLYRAPSANMPGAAPSRSLERREARGRRRTAGYRGGRGKPTSAFGDRIRGLRYNNREMGALRLENGQRALTEEIDAITRGGSYGPSSGYGWRALQPEAKGLNERLVAVIKAAQALRKEGRLEAARNRFAYAFLLESAVANFGQAPKETKVDPLAEIKSINATLLKSWTKDLPALDERLDLVLRNRSLEEALGDIARTSGVTVKLIPGSTDDAAAIVGRDGVRVTFLDLRNATAVQALDWVLRPLRMDWRVARGTVVAGAARRGGVEAPWVYDALALALPEQKEFEKEKDRQKRIEAVRKSMDAFIAAVRKHLGSDEAVHWYAPGQVLVFADATQHEKARKLFAQLADPNATVPAELAPLHKVTSARAESRKDALHKVRVAREKFRVLAALQRYSWRLLADAAEGRLDLEALTELQIAWSSPRMTEIVKNAKTWLPMRSLWTIHEAARALPDQKELSALLRSARLTVMNQPTEALKALQKSPQDRAAFFNVSYAALLMRDDAGFAATALSLLSAAGKKTPALAPAQAAAEILIAREDPTDARPLMTAVQKGVVGEDAVVLVALACRCAGGDAWTTFRAEAKRLLGKQPLPGSVIVLVNRLARTRLPLVALR